MKKTRLIVVLIVLFLSLISVQAAVFCGECNYELLEDCSSDGDNLHDDWEMHYFTNLTQVDLDDYDDDSLTNLKEFELCSDPTNNDTDGDNYTDDFEFDYGTNISNIEEYPSIDTIFNITLVEPTYGVSAEYPYDLIITTKKPADCKFSTKANDNYDDIVSPNQIFTTSDNLEHELEMPSSIETTIFVYCKLVENNYVNDGSPKRIVLSVDETNPEILAISATPDLILEKYETTLEIETDELTVCRFVTESMEEEDIQVLFEGVPESNFTTHTEKVLTDETVPKLEDGKKYTMYGICLNKAGLADVAPIEFEVDLSRTNRITEKYPKGFINSLTPEIKLVTNKEASCKYGEGYTESFTAVDPYTHTDRIFENLSKGLNEIEVMCLFNDAGVVEDEIKFFVDTQNPNLTIDAVLETCNYKRLDISYEAEDNLDDGIDFYNVRLVDSNSNLLYNEDTDETEVELDNLNLSRGKTYTWKVTAVDIAGNNITKQHQVDILLSTDEKCAVNLAPRVNASGVLTENGVNVDLDCIDDGSCVTMSYLILDEDCDSCNACEYETYSYTSSILIRETSTLCYNATDDKNKTRQSTIQVKIEECEEDDDPDLCCIKKKASICYGSNCNQIEEVTCDLTNLDTDGDGMTDEEEEECGLDPDDATDAEEDTDDDGLSNMDECLIHGTDWNDEDTDGDGYTDGEEIDELTLPTDPDDFPIDEFADTDGDGMKDGEEVECGLDLKDPDDADEDDDGDGLINSEECEWGTELDKKDTDGDGYSDKEEVDKGTSPTDEEEFPKSHFLNIVLFILGIGALVGGFMFFSKPSSTVSAGKTPNTGKPLVDFKDARTEMQNVQQQNAAQQPQQQPVKEDLDFEIKKKRDMLRLKKMSSVFDEFAEDSAGSEEDSETDKKKKKDAFDKLDEM